MTAPIYDLNFVDIDGKKQSVAQYRGDVLLVVNVASECGFAKQYAGLQQLHERLGSKGLRIIGFPCYQFAGQEAGDEAQIKQFCQSRFGVTFGLSQKIEVRGAQAHPIFTYLCEAAPGLLGSKAIKWNFTKFLIDRDGMPQQRYAPKTEPAELEADINACLQKPAASA